MREVGVWLGWLNCLYLIDDLICDVCIWIDLVVVDLRDGEYDWEVCILGDFEGGLVNFVYEFLFNWFFKLC